VGVHGKFGTLPFTVSALDRLVVVTVSPLARLGGECDAHPAAAAVAAMTISIAGHRTRRVDVIRIV
jgi:hypothetical protein